MPSLPPTTEPARRRSDDAADSTGELKNPGHGSLTRRPFLVVLAGPRLGEMIALPPTLLIGRDPEADFQVLDEAVSRRHARLQVSGERGQLHDLDTHNGTWVDGERISTRELGDGDCFRVGQTTVLRLSFLSSEGEARKRRQLETALRDPLLPTFNALYFRQRLEAELAFAARRGLPLGLLGIGLDRFEFVNRVHGTKAADDLLRRVAEVIHGAVRADDVLGRAEGDVLALIARQTNLEGATRLAERLRGVIADARFQVGHRPVELRVSIGVAAIGATSGSGAERPVDDLLAATWEALADAKSRGRNRVAIEEQSFVSETDPGAPAASPMDDHP